MILLLTRNLNSFMFFIKVLQMFIQIKKTVLHRFRKIHF